MLAMLLAMEQNKFEDLPAIVVPLPVPVPVGGAVPSLPTQCPLCGAAVIRPAWLCTFTDKLTWNCRDNDCRNSLGVMEAN
jgi:hypothetical protein